ncbi:MAG: hypothetical protein N4A76_01145 [Firmicutes bacterium]|jgi:hypothetical protein|nr:hypothetical protein [Bacillota bacterium]
MMKKILASILLTISILSASLNYTYADEKQITKFQKESTSEISIEKYISILPFDLSKEDMIKSKKLLRAINEAFNKNELALAQEKIDEFYVIVSKYWMSENTLRILLPFNEMMKFGSDLFTNEEKEFLQNQYKKLNKLRTEKKFEEYFKLIKEIHNQYYDTLGKSIGDANSELQLIQYIKGGDQLTAKDLIDYTFDDYLHVLPFEIKDTDYEKGKDIFARVVDSLKKEKHQEAQKITLELNNLLAPYWIKDETLSLILPHEKYSKEAIQYFPRMRQLELNNIYSEVKVAQKNENYDIYFSSINKYFSTLGLSIKEYYNDYFDEIVFIRS